MPEGDAITSAMDLFVAKMIQTAAIVIKDVQVEARYDDIESRFTCDQRLIVKRDNQFVSRYKAPCRVGELDTFDSFWR